MRCGASEIDGNGGEIVSSRTINRPTPAAAGRVAARWPPSKPRSTTLRPPSHRALGLLPVQRRAIAHRPRPLAGVKEDGEHGWKTRRSRSQTGCDRVRSDLRNILAILQYSP
nr:unnamed protein product [Digitaria exilis]